MRIVTHNGKMHSDEVSSIALLTGYFANKNIEVSVLRTRDAEKFLETDILIDVGLEYDHENNKYDHHQNDFNEIWDNGGILLSSIGLIWRHYGSEIIQMYLTENCEEYDDGFNYTEETINELKNIIYYKLIQEIDANDNGILSKDSYISTLVSALNGDINDEETQNINFNRAVSLVGNIFDIKFKEIINSYFNFQKDLEIVQDMDLFGPYLVIETNIPTIFKCISELDPECKIKFCIFVGDNEYTIKTRNNNFKPICPILPEDILKQSENDIIFVHKGGFLAKTKTLETAKHIVNLSLLNMIDFNIEEDEYEELPHLEVLKDRRLMGLTGLAVGSMAALGILYWNQNDQ